VEGANAGGVRRVLTDQEKAPKDHRLGGKKKNRKEIQKKRREVIDLDRKTCRFTQTRGKKRPGEKERRRTETKKNSGRRKDH